MGNGGWRGFNPRGNICRCPIAFKQRINQGLGDFCGCTAASPAQGTVFLSELFQCHRQKRTCHGLASAAVRSARITAWQNHILAEQYRCLVHVISRKPDPALKQPSRLWLTVPHALKADVRVPLMTLAVTFQSVWHASSVPAASVSSLGVGVRWKRMRERSDAYESAMYERL